jgi:hypothetical protein
MGRYTIPELLFVPEFFTGTYLYIPALGKTSIVVHQWTAKQYWVDRQCFKQEDNNIYSLEKVQIN